MKHLKLYENFDWGEDDFDFEDESPNILDINDLKNLTVKINNKNLINRFVDLLNKLDIKWKDTGKLIGNYGYNYIKSKKHNIQFIKKNNKIFIVWAMKKSNISIDEFLKKYENL